MAVRDDGNEVSDHWVDAGPFRAQLRFLMASGSLTVDMMLLPLPASLPDWSTVCSTDVAAARCGGSAPTPRAG